MMESSNLNLDLHHQDDFHGSSSSTSFVTPSFHFPTGRNHADWNQDLLLLNNGDFIPSTIKVSHEMPMVQDLGFQWCGDGNGEGYLLPKNIKEELFLRDHHPSNLQDYHDSMPSHAKNELLDQFNAALQPASAAELGFSPVSLGSFGRGGSSFSMVLPTTNISAAGSSHPLSQYPSSLGMDLQALDLLASARFGRSAFCQPNSVDNVALLREDLAYGLSHFQEQAQAPSTTGHKISSPSVSGVTEAKRGAGSSLEYKTSQSAAKKTRFETRSSFTPFKVRKEKLGDRIAALQQLVAPFGKTDTASVLMEAIGYIKFLQDQVETLSVPYMRSSNNKKLMRTSQGGAGEERDEPKPDLRSRGLCLVPLSCTSYVTNMNGGAWSPPNYRGGS